MRRRPLPWLAVLLQALALGCAADPSPDTDGPAQLDRSTPADQTRLEAPVQAQDLSPPDLSPSDVAPTPCPPDMVLVDSLPAPPGLRFCIDRHEAPNQAGADPLVMYSFVEAAARCQARSKRLCFDDEWTLACATPAGLKYPYGNTHQPGVCNDLCGNVEEWTRRRNGGGGAQFLGNLKGRYWAEARTCQSGVTTHANAFRFYEIGFRCCADPR